MRSGGRAALGLGLVAAAQVAWLPLMLGRPESLAVGALQVVAMAAAAAGLAAGAGGRSALAAGLALYAAGAVVSSFRFLSGEVATAIDGFGTLGAVLAAWGAVLWALDPARAAARVQTLRVAFAVGALSQVLWLLYDVPGNALAWVPGNVLALAGFALAARHLGAPPAPRAAAAPSAPADS